MLVFVLVTIFLFLLGTILGSFLNVIIYRSIVGESWVYGRSHCEHCKKKIRWYDNFPLLSYAVLRGKCRFCRTPISISHPVIEFLTGTLLVWWYWGGSLFFRLTSQPFHYVQPLFWLLVGIILLIIFFTDLLYMIIPDEAVVALTFLTLVYRISLTIFGLMQLSDFIRTLIAALLCGAGFLLLWIFTKGKGMGLGDAKLAVPFGLLLGWPSILVGIFISFVSGAVVSLALVMTRKKKMKQTVPFGPFMIFGTLIALLWGNTIFTWYMHFLR